MYLHHVIQLFQQIVASSHIKVKKGTCRVFYMASPIHAPESAEKYKET